jgi:hypothetical protein
MVQSIIRLVVHAVFGLGVLTAFTSFHPAEAGRVGKAVGGVVAKTAVVNGANSLRRSSDGDETSASATAQSQTPKVLNRWDMQRKPDRASDESNTSIDEGASDAQSAAASSNEPSPVVVTIPTDKAAPSLLTSSEPSRSSISSNEPCAPGQSCVVCLAGCPDSRGQIVHRQQQIARKD